MDMSTKTRSLRKRRGRSPGRLFNLGTYNVGHIGKRAVRVFVPPGYDSAEKEHPLLVMWDGQNVFDDEGSFAGGWHVHEAVSRRAMRGKKAPVVVGINHGNEWRLRELSPWVSSGESVAELFLDFV